MKTQRNVNENAEIVIPKGDFPSCTKSSGPLKLGNNRATAKIG